MIDLICLVVTVVLETTVLNKNSRIAPAHSTHSTRSTHGTRLLSYIIATVHAFKNIYT